MFGKMAPGDWCGVGESLQSLVGGCIEPTSSPLQNCSRKGLPASQALKAGWAIPWIPSAASAGHCWRPVDWRRSLTLFTQVPTLRTPAGGPAPTLGQMLSHSKLVALSVHLPGPGASRLSLLKMRGPLARAKSWDCP